MTSDSEIETWLTFDDVLILPRKSAVLPASVSLRTKLTNNPDLDNIIMDKPIVSAPMDTVTESKMAIALAKLGCIGVIHKNMSIERQSEEVRLVKNNFKWMIDKPLTLYPNMSVAQAVELLAQYKYSGAPVVDNGRLIGVLTNRDIKFAPQENLLVSDIMSCDNLITTRSNISYQEAMAILGKHRIERLIVVDNEYKCTGIITMHDLQKCKSYAHSTIDGNNLLRVAAAVGVNDGIDRDRARSLCQAGVDTIVVDTAHGHSKRVFDMVRWIKSEFPYMPVVAGNVATPEGALYLIEAGADAIKVGIGPGSICTTRIVAGVGAPQLSAIMKVAQAVRQAVGDRVTVIADGGMRASGDIAKAIAAGAYSVMLGSLLAGTSESPGSLIVYKGDSYKSYRGMGSTGAMAAGSADRYGHSIKPVAEGVEGIVPFKGKVYETIARLTGGLRSAFGYTGNETVNDMQKNCRFIRITSAGLHESHPHDVHVTQEAG